MNEKSHWKVAGNDIDIKQKKDIGKFHKQNQLFHKCTHLTIELNPKLKAHVSQKSPSLIN